MHARNIPISYGRLAGKISEDKKFYRTLWIPTAPTFFYTSITHPGIRAENFYSVSAPLKIVSELSKKDAEQKLIDASVKYVFVPEDTDHTIFLTDRKYDEKLYRKTVSAMDKVNYLKKVDTAGKIVIYEVPNTKDHFWSRSEKTKITYTYINPTKYEVKVKDAKKGEIIVFSEKYDPLWMIGYRENDRTIRFGQSEPYKKLLNSFRLPKDGSYTMEVYYLPQQWVGIGGYISIITIVLVSVLLVLTNKNNMDSRIRGNDKF